VNEAKVAAPRAAAKLRSSARTTVTLRRDGIRPKLDGHVGRKALRDTVATPMWNRWMRAGLPACAVAPAAPSMATPKGECELFATDRHAMT
jgi:hypothetical protein